jgi:hypothetical protein
VRHLLWRDCCPTRRFQGHIVNSLEIARREHTVHAVVEVDVTETRRAIRRWRRATGTALSLTSYVTPCFARVVGEAPELHAYRKGRREVGVFPSVDVHVVVEREAEGQKIAVPHISRGAQAKSPGEILAEVAACQREAVPPPTSAPWLP